MNTNPIAKRILCFGDSNTHGTMPYPYDWAPKVRYPANDRRTWILQDKLWNNYEVIEEWLWWRMIHHDDFNLVSPIKLASNFFEWLILSHKPLNLIIVWLWVNDIKPKCNLTIEQIISNFQKYILNIADKHNIKLLIISPPNIIDNLMPVFTEWSSEKAKQLNKAYKLFCESNDIYYLDLQSELMCWSDWVHLINDSHILLWQSISEEIKKII